MMIQVEGRHLSIDSFMAELSHLLREGDTSKATGLLDKAAENCIQEPEVAFHIASTYCNIGQTAKSKSILDLLSKNKSHAIWMRATLDMSHVLIQEGDLLEAERLLWKAHQSERLNPWPIYRLIEIYDKKNELQNAEKAVRDFEELNGKGTDLLSQLFMGSAARHIFEQQRVDTTSLTRKTTIPSLSRCGMISMVKNEDDIFGASLRHHYALGIRNFCVVDNDSTDQTAAVVAQFREEHDDCFLLYINDPGKKHYQAKKMDVYGDAFVAAAKMDGKSIDWIFYLDADEFIAPLASKSNHDHHRRSSDLFEQALNDPTKHVLVFHWVHGVSSEVLDVTPANTHPFEVYDNFQEKVDPIVSKVALRTGLKPTQGNHTVDGDAPSIASYVNMAQAGWCLLHFPMRSVEQYRRKVINGAAANNSAPGLETAATHWKTYYEEYKMHGDNVFRQIVQNFIRNIRSSIPDRS
ncbi:hypothetical protein DK419_00890 [Methylobacterium terrae]|uniref:Glycosyltransferase family 2 protein n=1 Tax=Methylobacterium terrae TaxID=2202827 RepID=A0A2U8WFR8_9HYPH|nr:glycosyltransferase family 2 protein [Methylobacterium terrae]AWN45065.1 hypothetical protein DK419_00890 [Methylobacterium terrae]